MSYILDALRRAEAERARGLVPGLHSPGLPAGGAPPMPAAGRSTLPRTPWQLTVLGLALAVLGAAMGAWWVGSSSAGKTTVSVAGQQDPGPASGHGGVAPTALASGAPPAHAGVAIEARPAAVPGAVPAAAPVAAHGAPGRAEPGAEPGSETQAVAAGVLPAGAASPEAVALRLPTPAPAPAPAVQAVAAGQEGAAPAAPAAAAQTQGPAVSPAPAPSAAPAAPATAAAVPPPPPGPTASNTAAAPAPIPLAALPADLRAAWPPLAIGGSIYSDNPGSRFVIANGQVVREGQTAAPGVVVERIGRDAVVLQWRGLRVQVPV